MSLRSTFDGLLRVATIDDKHQLFGFFLAGITSYQAGLLADHVQHLQTRRDRRLFAAWIESCRPNCCECSDPLRCYTNGPCFLTDRKSVV